MRMGSYYNEILHTICWNKIKNFYFFLLHFSQSRIVSCFLSQSRSVPCFSPKILTKVAIFVYHSFRFIINKTTLLTRVDKIVIVILWKFQNVKVETKTILSTLVNRDDATFQICTKLKFLLKHLILLCIKLYKL